jgi:hypothetical protein
MSPRKVKSQNVLLVLVALLATIGLARGGHEVPVYPSYYPHVITVETMPPERATDLLRDAKLHAYLGPELRFPGAVPASVRAVESLGNFVIVRINPERLAPDERSACAVVDAIVRDMAGRDGFVFHPYPVTPLHGDYLYHVDRAEAEKRRLLGEPATPLRNLRVKVGGVRVLFARNGGRKGRTGMPRSRRSASRNWWPVRGIRSMAGSGRPGSRPGGFTPSAFWPMRPTTRKRGIAPRPCRNVSRPGIIATR